MGGTELGAEKELGTTGLKMDDITVVDPRSLKRAVAAAALGNTMEWFDFGVYSYMAVTVGKVFFPATSPGAQLISTFATFAAAFLIRPLGGLFFGPLGDRVGRTKVLAATMIMMAVGTFTIGLIPSYATIGLWAPALLLLARLVQGFSTGGEYGGATTFIAEYSSDKRRGFMGSWLEFGTLVGYVMGAGLVTLLTTMLSQQDLLDWGWRLPFLIAGPLGLIGLYLRMKLEETPAFQKLMEAKDAKDAEERTKPRRQLREMFVGQWKPMVLCLGLVLVFNVTDYMLLSYVPSYLTSTVGFSESGGLAVVIVVMLLMMAVITFLGRLSDRVGRKPILMVGCIGFLVASVPCFMLMQVGSAAAVFVGLFVLCMFLVCFTAAMPAALPALFPTKIRYGALSIGFNVSVSLFGGTTPLVAAALVEGTHNAMMPAYYLMAAAVIGAVSVYFTTESAGKPLKGSPPAVETMREAREFINR